MHHSRTPRKTVLPGTIAACTLVVAATALAGANPAPSGTAAIDVSIGAYTKHEVVGEELVDVPVEARSATLDRVKVVRFTGADGQSELRMLFADEPIDQVILATCYGEHYVSEWRQTTDEPALYMVVKEGADPPYGGTLYPVAPFQSDAPFPELKVEKDSVSGRLEVGDTGPDWHAAGSFNAPITNVTMIEPVTGKAATSSPQAKLMIDMMTALSKGDLEGFLGLMTPEARASIEKEIEDVPKEELDQAIGSFMTPPDELRALMATGKAELWSDGEYAKLSLAGDPGDGSTTTVAMTFAKRDGRWLGN